MRTATLGGVVGPVIFTLVVVASAAGRSDYSHMRNFISELGANGAANTALMNYAGFLLGGILIATFGIALFYILPSDRITKFASILVALFGLGIAVSGIISCDFGCPQGSGTLENLLHNSIAPAAFLCQIIAAICFGIRWRRDHTLRKLSTYSIASGIAALALLATLVSSLESRELTGLWQRLLLFVLFQWCVVVSATMARYEPTIPSSNVPAAIDD